MTEKVVIEAPVTRSVATQIGKAPLKTISKRTRRIQAKPQVRTVGIQCDLLKGKPVAKPPLRECDDEMSDDEDEVDTFQNDPDFLVESDPDDSGSESDDETVAFPLGEVVRPSDEKQFLVSESALCALLKTCQRCGRHCDTVVHHCQGMMVSTMSTCSAGHVLEWKSQSTHNSLPWGNLTTAAAIFFSGSNASKVIRLFEILKLQTFSKRTFFRIQKSYLVPSVVEVWNFERERNVVERLGKQLILGGDARCDSPGYSAKYGFYSLMDLDSQTVLDIQCNEVKGSTHMELEGLKRGLLKLKAERLNIKSLITDRHVMVKKFMKGEEEIIHNFDVRHVAKDVSKKLEGLAKKRGQRLLSLG
ncbi:uncharacterized protein LOC135478187 [Liolophura sinensis]|uniref:uncharacterized protein LOC135478187 n=1 Tax=Liolophura sinensis TaxID=3198878 RepID=UPI00315801AC